MIFGSVCSGIEAASVAWKPLGWRCAFVSEIDAFPRAVLRHHFPEVPLHGDFTTIQAGDYAAIDLLVGGTPCQSFSVAGLRGGLADDRGNLALELLRLAGRLRPRWLVWENVPGVLSSNGGRDFGAFLGGLGELGYGWAYRVLDAQFFGLAQRRKRVFVVGYLGDWRRAAAVLFERQSLSGNPPPRRKKGQKVASPIAAGVAASSGYRNDADTADNLVAKSLSGGAQPSHREDSDTHVPVAFGGNDTSGPIDVATARNAHGGPHGRLDFESETFIAHALKGEGFDASEDGSGRGTPLIPVHTFDARQSDVIQYGDQAGPLDTDGHTQAICFSAKDHGADAGDLAPTLRAGGHAESHANAGVMPAVAFMWQAGGDGTSSGAFSEEYAPTLQRAQTPAVLTLAVRGRGESHDLEWRDDGTANALLTPNGGRGGIGVGAIAFDTTQITHPDNRSNPQPGDPAGTLAKGGHAPAVAFTASNLSNSAAWESEVYPTINATPPSETAGLQYGIRSGVAVRRLTPRECERLQGFPDDWTLIPYRGKPAADGPRYRAIGNSMAVPCMRWIGERIGAVEAIAERQVA